MKSGSIFSMRETCWFSFESIMLTTDSLLEVEWRLSLAILVPRLSLSNVCDEIESMLVPRPSETTLRNWTLAMFMVPPIVRYSMH